jgi:hypothetical protein
METTVIVSADDLPYLSFLPRLRGYRDENTSELRITDDYTGKLGQIRNELMSEVVSRLREKDPEKISSETFRQALSGLSAMIPVIVIRRDEIALVDTFPIDETLSTFEESSSSRRQNTRDLAYKEASEPRLLRFLLWLFIAWLLRRWT